MKLKIFLSLILITILLSFSSTFLFYSYYIIQDTQELDMKMKVGEIIGFDTNTSVISFGTMPQKGVSKRSVILKNTGNEPLKVHIGKTGEMSKWVYVSEEEFLLQANETKELIFTAVLSRDVEEGAYKGKVKFIFTRVI